MKRVWAAWKRVARRIGDWQARVLLTIFYYTVFAPFALLARSARKPRCGWQPRPDPDNDPLARAGRQY
ncbi:MAG TPA: hypothetical protein VN442_14195 [Bryobacteraceae bacterium]|nr:hypothetical protein [Bryobacteraceae bacterium]